MNLKCAIYTRVSTDMQAEVEFNSCQAQEERIKSFINSQESMELYKVYTDAGFSGGNLDRPALQELINDIRDEKINIVLTYKIDRLTRSPKDFYSLIEVFETYKVDFISVTERFDTSTPSGRLLRNIMLTFAQFERELAKERTKDKMFQRAQKGMWNGGIVPFGYKAIDKKLIIHAHEAKKLREMFQIYITTKSSSKTYEILKESHITDKKGNIFSKGSLKYIFNNILYTGKTKYEDNVYQGLHEAIISEDLFNLAKEVRKEKVVNLRLNKSFPLAGLVRCKECGSLMTPSFTTKNKKDRYYYYRCTSTFKKEWNSCTTRQISAEKLEDYILDTIKRLSLDEDYAYNLAFRLNNEKVRYSSTKNTLPPGRSGLEISQNEQEYDHKTIISILKNVAENYGNVTKLERNILLRNALKGILYSKQQIELTLYYRLPYEKNRPQNLLSTSSPFPDDFKSSFRPQNKKPADDLTGSYLKIGCPAWTRTRKRGSKGHWVTITQPGSV